MRIKISFCTIAFRHRPMLLEDILFIISELGYDGVEIWSKHLEKYEASLDKIKNILKWQNLEVNMISPYFDFTRSYKKWYESIENAKKYICIAKELGCPLIRCFTGKVPSEFATEKQWNGCVEGIKYISRVAKKEGITIAIETHPSTLADTISSTLKLIEKINEENVKINLDFYNLYEVDNTDPLTAIEKLYPYVVNIHAKNAVLSEGRISPFRYVLGKNHMLKNIRYLSCGDLNYNLVLEELVKRGYNGYISIECFETRRSPLRVAKDEIKWFRQVMNNLLTARQIESSR